MKKIVFLILILLFIFACVYYFFNSDNKEISSCISCHEGIETVSASHADLSCTDCHGGNSLTMDKDNAHKNMYGKNNPSDPSVWMQTCGKCHEYEVKRVSSSLMLTNTGIIKNTLAAWGEENGKLYSQNNNDKIYGKDGNIITIDNISEYDTISADMYRKFCSACHVGQAADMGYQGVHSSGCATCHFPYGDFGEYSGNDKSMQGKSMHSVTHEMKSLPDDNVCLACHNRSGRIALSYKGLYDGNNALVPLKEGIPGPDLTSGLRNTRHFQDDIHHARGMECIDCHTTMEIMGDGYYYENMYEQIEVSCESCHGSYTEKPKTTEAVKENMVPYLKGSSYIDKIEYGSKMVLTDKGRPYSNVYEKDNKIILMSKRTGKEREVKVITGTMEHNIQGHNKMECYTCHSANVIQCYGCHVEYNETETMFDFVKNEETKGLFIETEDLRTFYPFPLAFNQKGKIAPVTPGCQTFLTHIDENGNVVSNDKMVDFRGKPQMKYAPFYGHNTGKKAVSCESCHSTLFFYGFGDGLFSADNGTLTSATRCDNCPVPLNSIYAVENGEFKSKSDIVREGSSPLSRQEIVNAIDVMKCIVCHNEKDSKYYQQDIDYEKILNDDIHKPLIR